MDRLLIDFFEETLEVPVEWLRFGKMQATKVRVSESEGVSKFRVKAFMQYISTTLMSPACPSSILDKKMKSHIPCLWVFQWVFRRNSTSQSSLGCPFCPLHVLNLNRRGWSYGNPQHKRMQPIEWTNKNYLIAWFQIHVTYSISMGTLGSNQRDQH